MNRRGFLEALLAAGVAPAIVRASSLMPVFATAESGLLVPAEIRLKMLTISDITRESLKLMHEKMWALQRNIEGDLAGFVVGDVITLERRKT